MPVEKLKTMKCKVLNYDRNTQKLDVDFSGYGIRINDVSKDVGEYVTIRYRGEIGSPNFQYRL